MKTPPEKNSSWPETREGRYLEQYLQMITVIQGEIEQTTLSARIHKAFKKLISLVEKHKSEVLKNERL